jgi:hypothetical protein
MEINWDAIGAVGETISAVAVLATLFYLAVQIRQNNHHVEETLRSLRLDSTRSTVESFARYRALVSQSDLADIYARGLADSSALSVPERIQFGAILDEFLFCYAAMHERTLEGTYEKSSWDAHFPSLKEHMAYPGVVSWWRKGKRKFPPAFVSIIDNG